MSLAMSRLSLKTLTGSVKLSYLLFKPPASKRLLTRHPLVIIHGLFGAKKNWESIAKALCKAGQQIITVDARNHGESPHSDAMDYRTMSLDVAQLLADLKLNHVNLLGHSMGGKIAMALALSEPDLINKLIIEDISPSLSLSAREFPQYIAALRKVHFDSSLKSLPLARKSADKQLYLTFPDGGVRNFILTNVEETPEGRFRWRVNLKAISRNLDELMSFPHFDSCFSGKTLFLGGANSAQISEQFYPEIYRLFPRTEIEHIDEAGHWVHADKPYEFMAAVQRFLRSTDSEDIMGSNF